MYNGTDDYEITIAYGELVDFGIPHKEGYQFVGWYDQKADGIQITDSSGKTIWTRTEGISNLYARFIPIEYEINYETNGGLFVESAPEFFDAENSINMNQIPNIRKFGYLFDGWKCENEEFKTTFGLYKDITLKANWIGTKVSYLTYIINEEIAIVDLSGIIKPGPHNYTIESSVKSVTFIGSKDRECNMKILVATRTEPLIIGLENMRFKPTNNYGYDAINSSGSGELFIYYKGTNEITGGTGTKGVSYYNQYSQATGNKNGVEGSVGGNGQNGGCGIRAEKVSLIAYDDNSSIVITGGEGGNGGQGGNGGNGIVATNALNVYGIGGKGGASGFGGEAGLGGQGGDAGATGSDGKNGKNGNSGEKGKLGLSGKSGYNTEGNEESVREYPYLFTKEFFELKMNRQI